MTTWTRYNLKNTAQLEKFPNFIFYSLHWCAIGRWCNLIQQYSTLKQNTRLLIYITYLNLQVSSSLAKSKNLQINDCPPTIKVFIFFHHFSFLCRNSVMEAVFFPAPYNSLTSHGTARSPIRVVKHFWCSYPVKGLSDVFLFLRQPHSLENHKVQTHKKARHECTCVQVTSVQVTQQEPLEQNTVTHHPLLSILWLPWVQHLLHPFHWLLQPWCDTAGMLAGQVLSVYSPASLKCRLTPTAHQVCLVSSILDT